MKKSEAAQILRDIILNHMNCESGCCGSDDIMYMTILCEIEDKLGMWPPDTMAEGHIVSAWEPEEPTL